MNTVKMFIKDGNFAPWLRTVFIMLGASVVYISLKYIDSVFLMTFGLVLAALGGYSSRAKMLGLKPFDNAYKKVKDSYKEDENKKNEADQDKNSS
ncbi:hypothetical protein QN379_17910 [Glaciimonas sp. Gout2]|uniref:hypothetical protein n=1 Tax=unclassified Glaciimonas TaxID=2644401 RepID=UPI002B227D20|nr:MULTISPECIES: hypothetical protein [unclassified Glaciimonas]MEB0012131.1 hypothetical protein [Glaciimonas sp. Cout2]MEB0083887.1 hypothetical protein [Glaciimonas sp. Gout2]